MQGSIITLPPDKERPIGSASLKDSDEAVADRIRLYIACFFGGPPDIVPRFITEPERTKIR